MGLLVLIGIFGTLCIVAAWIPQTIRTIRTKVTGMEPKFLWLYFFGSTALAVHAFIIFDAVFIALNLIATILDIVNIYYYYRYEIKMKKKAKIAKKNFKSKSKD